MRPGQVKDVAPQFVLQMNIDNIKFLEIMLINIVIGKNVRFHRALFSHSVWNLSSGSMLALYRAEFPSALHGCTLSVVYIRVSHIIS